MANITWSTTDKTTTITLSGTNNVTAAVNAAGASYVRGASGQTNGKFYFEVTHNVIGSATADETGLALPGSNITGASTGQIYLTTAGGLKINSSANVATLGASITAGTVVCWAVDLDNQRVWCRLGAAGNWNGSAGNSPATPSTGASFAVFGAIGISLLPFFYSTINAASVTANFGDSAFSGTVPTGFTAGIPTGGVSNALFTQEGAEAWVNYPSNAQFTQVGVEVWRSVADAVAASPTGALTMMLS